MLTILQKAYAEVLKRSIQKMRDCVREIDPAITDMFPAEYGDAMPVLFMLLTQPDLSLRNPVIDFKHRADDGDFEPLQDWENPENLPPYRQPMTDEEFQTAKRDAIERGRLWKRQPDIPVSLLFQRIMEQTCDDDPVQPSDTGGAPKTE